MRHNATWTKNKSILLTSVKVYANKKVREDKFLMTPNIVKDLFRSKNAQDFRSKFIKKYKLIDKVNLGSKAFKAGLCGHVRYYALPNKVANMLKKENFAVTYEAKAKKATGKKSARKKAVAVKK